jgi:hypothetical protein
MQKDQTPPRVFAVLTSKFIAYNEDFVHYLIAQEYERQQNSNLPKPSKDEMSAFRYELLRLVLIHQDIERAIALRPNTN